MLMLRNFSELERIETFELGVVHSHLVRGFQQVILEVLVARKDHLSVSGFEATGLMLCPRKAAVLSESGMVFKTRNVTDLGKKPSTVNRTDARNGGKSNGQIYYYEIT